MLAVSASFQYAGDTAGDLWFLPKLTNERKTFLKDHLLELAPVLNGLAKDLDMTRLNIKKMVYFFCQSQRKKHMDPDQELAKERHRNLTIWKEAMALVNDVYTTTKTFPKDEVWGLTSQIRRAGVSIASNIAEGSKRPDDDFRRFLSYSLGSLAELDTQLIIAEMQGYAPYAHEMKSRIIGLMAAIRRFAAALRK